MEESNYLNLNQLSIQGDISLQHIIDIEIKREINKHTELTIVGIIDEKEKDTYLDKIQYGAEINLKYGEGIAEKLFGGIIVDVEIKEYKRSYYVIIEAKSASYLMDQKLKKRSFNQINITYDDILNIVKNDYVQSGFISDDKAGQNVESLIIQYNETDFEFLKRMASRLGLVIVPEDLFNLPRLYFGISVRNSVELNVGDYEFIKYFDSFTEEKYEYKILTGQVLEIGCEVVLNNQRFIVVKSESKLVDSELKNTYTILDTSQIEVPRICNENIRGTAIGGTVIEVQGTAARVQLDIDNEAIYNWYEVIVGSNDSLYSMPYAGDRVKVYFGSNEEAQSSVSFTTYSGDGLNPDTKFWSNKDGKKVEFTPGSIEISAQSGTLNSIKLTDSSGIDIKSGLKITIRSSGSLSLNANSISIVGSNAVSLNHYPDPKVKNTGIPKGITIDSTDVSFKVEDAHFEGKEKKAYPIEAEPEPAFSEAPKEIQTKTVAAKSTAGQKNEARVESGEKTLLKGLGLAALAVGMAAAVLFTGGAALVVAGALMEGGIISTAIGVGVATAAVAGTAVGLEGAAMEGDIAEATVEEGCNEISNGQQGIDEEGYNRIRDGELGGDEEAYQEYQNKAIGLWETGMMINMTAATVGTEALPAAGVADMYLSSKLPNTLSEEENIIANNPFADPGTSNKYCIGGEEWNNYFKEVYGESNVEWTSKETISNTERLKISGWKYPPDDWLYLKYKDVYNNELYYNQANGNLNWPINNGFAEEFPGTEVLDEGMLVDRYGESYGNFFAPATDLYDTRALAPHSETANHYFYKVSQSVEVTSGKAAPWFGSRGGARQFIKYHENGKLYSIDELIDEGYLEDVTDLVKEGLIK
ncbi:hypothetical protein B0H69_005206 [Clostridium beijerinckii]|jgi:Phage late control gene D protein (GPD).|uniref:Glycohydrolase toxin TNT-related protein n=2 Tax=Clostridium beijerinckii TaxID=1520 RepID=A0AAE2V3C5_CLOBE|nr:glycohydrolase toxin TNT-related protein [Clostridium beijerinckii]ABR34789.1 hypothetical protein Cbei_2635 [Clostridium beijerinckii NCIMB 8052]AIU01350.1 hypothetical protein Cbs_2635 [Clostridium beijerinckii ATCC 35702]MBF7810581.1 glycohydrolase toxin TNT-related protein [Clostridium beijerinckii]NOW91298.1 hypothetical protein [Clostridium beijerinckii]NRT23856.1 hypothetical protein [Clostridium beijerinckii]